MIIEKSQCLHFIVLAFVLSTALCSAENVNQVDSVLGIINKKSGKEKLDLFNEHLKHFYTDLYYLDEFEKEARTQSSHLDLAFSYRNRLYYLAKEDKMDSMRFYINLIKDELSLFDKEKKSNQEEKNKYNSIKSTLNALQIEIYLYYNQYDLALLEVKKSLEYFKDPDLEGSAAYEEQAYLYMGVIYLHTKKWEESLENYQKANQIYEKMAKEGPQKRYAFFRSLEGIAFVNEKKGDLEKAMQVLDTLINKIENEHRAIQNPIPEDDVIYQLFRSRILSLMASVYIKEDKPEKARVLLDEIKEFISLMSSLPHSNFSTYYEAEAEYYIKTKQYNKAKEVIDLYLTDLSLNKHTGMFLHFNLLQSKVLNLEEKTGEAYELVNKLYHINDSINSSNFSSQVAEMQTMYKVEKAEMQAKQSDAMLKRTRVILAIAVVAFLLSVIIVYLLWKNSITLRKKNTQLHHQYTEIGNKNKKIQELQSERDSYISDEKKTTEGLHYELINKLEEYLQTTKIFQNQELTREELALKLGTNRQYLIEAIRESTGKTFNEYIYSYRLRYAYEKIVEDKGKTISEIYMDAGFSTRVTFNRAFKEAYGMSPSELREIAI